VILVSIDGQGGLNSGALVPPVGPVASPPHSVGPWALDYDRLIELADELSLDYRAATPFPHVVLDDFFPAALLDELLSEFPPADDDGWKLEDGRMQLKQQWRDANRLPPIAASFAALLQSAPFVSFLGRLTGVAGLVGDPHCHHGGLHQTATGGFLKVHADQLVQPALGLQRRVNVIVFLNRGWLPEWGADLELWDAAMTRCYRQIEPVFNRVVVFDAVGSNHGHPDPAMAPSGVLRRSVALYYYVSPAAPLASSDAGVPKAVVRARPGEVLPQRRQPSSRWRRMTRKVHSR
jgi:hypothetical protein